MEPRPLYQELVWWLLLACAAGCVAWVAWELWIKPEPLPQFICNPF